MREILTQPVATQPLPLAKAHALLAEALEKVEVVLNETVSSTVEMIPEVSHHLIGSGGKRIRPTLLLLMAQACRADVNQGVELSVATELFHNASLLHDDVVDRGHLRRGVTAAPRVFGNSASVLVGDFMMARAFGIVVQHGDLELLRQLSLVISAMAEGEVLQLIRSGKVTLSLPNYEEIISGKTAGLFSWCCRAGASLGPGGAELIEAAAKFGKAFGMAFQITDDVLDYTAAPEQSGKDLANDLQQGKTTLPLLLACEQDSKLLKIVESVAEGEPTEKDCFEIVRRVTDTKAISLALNYAREYSQKAIDSLAVVSDSSAVEHLRELANHITDRIELT